MLKFILELVARIFGMPEKVPPKKPQGGIGSTETQKEAKADAQEEKEEVRGPKLHRLKVKNDDPRLWSELAELQNKNRALYYLIIELWNFTQAEFKKDLVITMIFRTAAEQDYLYRKSEAYAKRKFKSPHQFWHAIDLRSWIYSKAERQKMVDFLNKQGKAQNNYYKWTAKVHEVGSNGLHFHIQFIPKT